MRTAFRLVSTLAIAASIWNAFAAFRLMAIGENDSPSMTDPATFMSPPLWCGLVIWPVCLVVGRYVGRWWVSEFLKPFTLIGESHGSTEQRGAPAECGR